MIAWPRFHQELVGSCELSGDGRPRPIELLLHSSHASFALSSAPRRIPVTGTLSLLGLADGRVISGTVDVSRLSTRPGAYCLGFETEDGRRLEIHAARLVSRLAPVFAASRILGELRAEGGVIAKLELRQDLRRGLSRWLVS